MSIVLAIEGAVGGGSSCLLQNQTILGCWSGSSETSRAEDLLANIDALLKNAGIEKAALDLIAVSNGPGSYTGIRVAIATTLGLGRALGIPCFGVSLFEAIACESNVTGRFVVALPIRKNEAAWQVFEKNPESFNPIDPPVADTIEKLADVLEVSRMGDIVTTANLARGLGGTPGSEREIHVLDHGSCLAFYIAASAGSGDREAPRAMYVSRYADGLPRR